MRRLLILFLLMAVCVPISQARRQQKKAGVVKKHVYTDSRYGFRLTLDDGWSFKIGKDEDGHRLFLTQKNYEIPTDYLDAEDYTKVPRLVVWAGETSLGATAFLDSLLSDSYESDLKKDVIRESDIINPMSASGTAKLEKLIPTARRTLEIAGASGVYWAGRVNYMMEVALSASTTSGKRVRGAYEGSLLLLKKDKTLLVFSTVSERNAFDNVMVQVMKMINSLQWGSQGSDKEQSKATDEEND
jgi:hypothetical protein